MLVPDNLLLYLAILYPAIIMQMGFITPDRIILGVIAILLIIEAVRRMAGLVLSVIGIVFILFAAFNHLIPGALGGKVIPLDYLINYLFLDTNSLLGAPMGVTATVVLPFILFGSLYPPAWVCLCLFNRAIYTRSALFPMSQEGF